MEYIKKYWYVALLLLGTVILGISTLFISLQLQQRESITTEESQAVTPECTLTFTIVLDTPTPSVTPTPVPPSCNQQCTSVFGCDTGLTCYNGFCRNPSCVEESSCVCSAPTPNPSVTVNPSSTPTNTNTPRPTNTPAPGSCNATCTSNTDCANSFICSNGFCRNPQCTEQSNCACYFVPTPKVPVTGTGTTLVGVAVIAGGIILLLLGLAF